MILTHRHTIPKKLRDRLRRCKLLVFDFDGVFTDNFVYVNDKGEEMVRCSRSDTFGLKELLAAGVMVVILSTEKNPIVQHRAKKLGIPCVNGLRDKGAALQQEMQKRDTTAEQTVYVGNDVNDMPCFEVAGTSIAVADAYPSVKERADYVTQATGGNGAVREVIELLLQAKRIS